MKEENRRYFEWLVKREGEDTAKKIIKDEEWRESVIYKYVDKFHEMSDDERLALINKVIDKYNSDAYRNRYWDEGPKDLYWIYYSYAARYGTDVTGEMCKKYPHQCGFMSSVFISPEGYYVQKVDGSVSSIHVVTKEQFFGWCAMEEHWQKQ